MNENKEELIDEEKAKKKEQFLLKRTRIMHILYKALRGQKLSIGELAIEFEVSKKSITRDINEIKHFLLINGDKFGDSELVYSRSENAYRLKSEDFLSSQELIGLLEILIGSRALSSEELISIIEKMQTFTSREDEKLIKGILQKELYKYSPVDKDCRSVLENLWVIAKAIKNQNEISIDYIRMNRSLGFKRIRPVSIMFSDYYFYLFAYSIGDEEKIRFFRMDRIVNIQNHKETFSTEEYRFNEGELRQRIQFMFPGKTEKVKFEFSGPSTRAILDKLPTAKVVARNSGTDLIEAEVVYGRGFLMIMLSQGSWIKPISPQFFVDDMKHEIEEMAKHYNRG